MLVTTPKSQMFRLSSGSFSWLPLLLALEVGCFTLTGIHTRHRASALFGYLFNTFLDTWYISWVFSNLFLLSLVPPVTVAMEIGRGSLHSCCNSHVNENIESCLESHGLPYRSCARTHIHIYPHKIRLGRLMSNEWPLRLALVISRTQNNHHFPPTLPHLVGNIFCMSYWMCNRQLYFFFFFSTGWTNGNWKFRCLILGRENVIHFI